MTTKSLAMAFAAFFALAGAALAQPTDGGPPPGGGPGGPGGHGGGMRQACQADIAKLCGDVQPGQGGRGQIRQCLASHTDQLSDDCKAAMVRMQQWRSQHQQGGQDGPPPGPPPQN